MLDPLLTHLLDSARDGLFLHDEDFRFISVNPAGAALLGYSQAQLLQMGLPDIEPDFDRNSIGERLRSLRNGERLQTTGRPRRSDGQVVAVEVMVTALESDGRRMYAVDVRPIQRPAFPAATYRLKDMATALLASMQALQLDAHDGRPPSEGVLEDLAGIAATLIVTANQAATPPSGRPDLAEVIARSQARMSTLEGQAFQFTHPMVPVVVAMPLRGLEEALTHLLGTGIEAAQRRGETLRCTLSTGDDSAILRLHFGAPRQLTDIAVAWQLLSDHGGQVQLLGEDLRVRLPLAR